MIALTSRRSVLLAALATFVTLAAADVAATPRYHLPLSVAAGAVPRHHATAEARVDLAAFLADLDATLDLATLRVAELDTAGVVVHPVVAFQIDAVAGLDPTLDATFDLIFAVADSLPAGTTRHFRLLFDIMGAPEITPPPTPPALVHLDSLQYENQLTYLIATPLGDYYYHKAGAGLASMIDADGQDWIAFRDVAGSGALGEYRGIPNMVFTLNNANASFFHPGFTNANSEVVNHGPLKVTIRSKTLPVNDRWDVRWEFYRDRARMTVERVGAAQGGKYWFLYEGTPGGLLDAGDVVVRSDGTTTSAYTTAGRWETTLADPAWVYFRDPTASRYLYVSDDQGDNQPDSYRPQGNTGQPPQMTVFGFGRVLNNSPSPLIPRLTGVDRSFTVGFGEDHTVAPVNIAAALAALEVTVGDPTGPAPTSAPPTLVTALAPNHPNPFNPATRIEFTLATDGPVRLTVHDLAGRRVRSLLAATAPAGRHAAAWDGRDEAGQPAPAGVYIYRLQADGTVVSRKMTLVK